MAQVANKTIKGPFDDHPQFYLADNRQYRGSNPVTRVTLEAKMSVLLPEWLVRNKSVLDLGSCLGAAGQWALFYGAASYTGVEVQDAYVTKSRDLLSHWGDCCRVVEADIRSFLRSCDTGAFDVVAAAGVVFHFIDPKAIIDEMCRVAKGSVVVESLHPNCVRDGTVSSHALVTEYTFNQDVNLAEGKESLTGLCAGSTVAAMDIFFRLNQFEKKEDTLPFPVSPDTVIYTDTALTRGNVPIRYAVRYQRKPEMRRLKTLEENLPRAEGIRKSWRMDPSYTEGTIKNKKVAARVRSTFKQWEFDAEIAASFEKIAETSIPNYHLVLDKTIEVIRKRGYNNPKIIDVGSAIGTMLKKLYDNGFRNIYGVDNSPDMLARSFANATLIQSDTFPSEYGKFDVVIANWVLHFVHNREAYLQSIAKALSPGGILILSEKVTSSDFAHSLYHDFKKRQGLTQEDIDCKQKQLVGVLTPYPLSWYFEVLHNLGFKHVDIIDASYAFTTLMASAGDN